MDSYYQAWHQQADDLHYKLQDAFADSDSQACQDLKQRVRDLINDLAQQRSPHDIEDCIKQIIDLIEPARNGSQTFLNAQNAVTFHDAFERMRREVRSHPHYA